MNFKKKSKNYSFSYPKIVALSFLLIISVGTVLLFLPVSSKGGEVSFTDALFTATSASCVTGLTVFDTFTQWSLFGQIVILCLIQVGGLGFITILSTVTVIIRKRISLKEKMLLKESVGSVYLGGVTGLGKLVLQGTCLFEGVGAILLATRFVPMLGWKNGVYTAVFLSVSAFCNAGFDVLGAVCPNSSFVTVNNDPVILITIMILIVAGGLGFIVWEDLLRHKFRFRNYNLHTKIVLVTTGILIISGAAVFMITEHSNTFADMGFGQSLLNAFFADITTRTAGFSSVNSGDLTNASKFLTMIFMFIGGSTGSTAGGIKTTTVAVLFLCVTATLKNHSDINAFGKRIDENAVRKAVSIVCINISEIFISVMLISFLQSDLTFIDITFECVSALGTVGMSAGITSLLGTASRLIIILLMFTGRLTSLVFALMFYIGKAKTTSQKPIGNVIIG